MPVDVQLVADSDLLPDVCDIERWVVAVLGGREREVCVRVVGDGEGRRLNAQYRDIDEATNVLSFVADGLPDGETLLGDLVICAPVVEREAREQNKRVEHHYAHMVVHGVLHLLGYDHQFDGEAKEMENKERKVLVGLGISDPYSDRGTSSGKNR
tara:strand:- start:788 stop:1252 length:465 start_codon:yes stop_codon:yes gene_type:complete